MKKNLNIAYSIMKRNKRKMAQGGMIENEELHPNHEPGMGPQTDIQRDSILKPSNDNLKELHDEDLEERPMSTAHDMEDQPHGMLGMDAKSIVANLRAKHDNYPRPDDKYRDAYKLAEGGIVTDPQKAKAAQDSMRKAFHYAEGGEVDHLDSLSGHMEHLNAEEGLGDHQVNSQFMEDDSLSQDNSPMPEDLSRGSNMIQVEDQDDQKNKRLNKIMSMLHSKHYGKR